MRVSAGLILAVAVLVAAPAGAGATTVIIGPDLTQSVAVVPSCGSSTGQACSYVTTINPDGFGDRGSPIDGVLTSARIKTNGGATTVDVRVLRPDPVLPSNFLNVGPEIPISVPDVATSSTGVISEATGLHHRMNAHDRLGIGWNQPSTLLNFGWMNGSSACASRQGSNGGHPVDTTVQYDTTSCNLQVLVQGTIETDADHDGYGDDTQDQCPTDASTHGPCSTTTSTTPPPHKKKCKKKKKHRSADAVIAKKCKKKHH